MTNLATDELNDDELDEFYCTYKKKFLNQSLLFVKKCYKMLLSKNKSKYFFQPSNEIKSNGEHLAA